MNPYIQLSKVAGVLSHRAELIKADGTVIKLYVKPETRENEQLASNVPTTLVVREWSCDYRNFIVDEIPYFPSGGDVLKVFSDNETSLTYDVARDSINGRFWDWQYLRPGYRVRFFTKYNPKEN